MERFLHREGTFEAHRGQIVQKYGWPGAALKS